MRARNPHKADVFPLLNVNKSASRLNRLAQNLHVHLRVVFVYRDSLLVNRIMITQYNCRKNVGLVHEKPQSFAKQVSKGSWSNIPTLKKPKAKYK